jgi:hypothetical protein
MLRIAVMVSIMRAAVASASASRQAATARGYGAIITDAVGLRIGSACQISSVMNGMNGCSRRMTRSSTVSSERRTLSLGSSPPYSVGLKLEVPVADLAPDEAVERRRRVIEAVRRQRRAGVVDRRLQARQDPRSGNDRVGTSRCFVRRERIC